ncbi:MAG: hypothetical protein K0R61_1578 [Microvirga sp.]|jgi:hypothetical protein|nr:hypothetical protein [Microvirga sp.]
MIRAVFALSTETAIEAPPCVLACDPAGHSGLLFGRHMEPERPLPDEGLTAGDGLARVHTEVCGWTLAT